MTLSLSVLQSPKIPKGIRKDSKTPSWKQEKSHFFQKIDFFGKSLIVPKNPKGDPSNSQNDAFSEPNFFKKK